FSIFSYPATSEISTLSLHDALPILRECRRCCCRGESSPTWAYQLREGTIVDRGLCDGAGHVARSRPSAARPLDRNRARGDEHVRSEEHTSELQSLTNLVCRLLLEKK